MIDELNKLIKDIDTVSNSEFLRQAVLQLRLIRRFVAYSLGITIQDAPTYGSIRRMQLLSGEEVVDALAKARELKSELLKLKLHPNQSYILSKMDDVIILLELESDERV